MLIYIDYNVDVEYASSGHLIIRQLLTVRNNIIITEIFNSTVTDFDIKVGQYQ